MKKLAACRLYTFIDFAYLHGRNPAELAEKLCEGGSDLIQLRAKNSAPDDIRRMAEAILPVTRNAGVGLVINDYPKIAIQVGAEFCHLGQEDFFNAGFRTAAQVTGCPKEIRLGLSTHAPEQARRALNAGPDYIAIGPVFATPTKPTASPVTLEYVRWAAASVSIPWFAIGGINLQNLDEVLTAGARRVCVVAAILNSSDVVETCRRFKERLLSLPLN